MRPVRRPVGLLGTAALLASGCATDRDGGYFGTTERKGKEVATFYVNNAAEPEYLDPGKAHDSASTTLAFQMFEGLTTYDPNDLHPVQGVAMHWEQSDDNRVFRFHLRPEARWSDGKPVRAHDFEYAWRRVLRPAFVSLAASALYSLKNGELWNLGKLKALKGDVVLRIEARADAAEAARLPKGTAVLVLATSPRKVITAVAPLAEAPADAKIVSYTKADAKKGAPEQLSLGAARPAAGPAPDGGWKDAEVTIVRQAAEIDCNGATDHWFEIARGGVRGFLPGCVLEPSKDKKTFALVAHHRSLPTYSAAPAASPADTRPAATGFVEADQLVEDATAVGVRATDEHTLDVELERPTPYFTDLTSFPTLFPVRQDVVEAFEKRGEPELWVRPENIVVNGPYTLDTWKFRYEITMKRNPHYWAKDSLKIHRIVWFEVDEMNTTMNLYKGGDLDYVGDQSSLPNDFMKFLESKKDFLRSFYLSTYWYEFNTKVAPVSDVRVRRALNLAVDKQQLVEKVTRGGQLPATHYVPDFTGLGYSDQAQADRAAGIDPFSTPDTVFNPTRARELLKEAGFEVMKDGDGWRASGFPPLAILYNTSEGHKQIAVALQDMWKRHLGVSATLRNEEWKVMLKNVRDGNFQVVRFGWGAEYNHPHTWLDTFLSYSPQNQTGWGEKRFDEMLLAASATPDQKLSIQRYREAEKVAVDGMAKMPLYFYTKSTLVKPWVKGYIGNPRNVRLMKWLWIDPAWRDHPNDNHTAAASLEFPKPGRLAPP